MNRLTQSEIERYLDGAMTDAEAEAFLHSLRGDREATRALADALRQDALLFEAMKGLGKQRRWFVGSRRTWWALSVAAAVLVAVTVGIMARVSSVPSGPSLAAWDAGVTIERDGQAIPAGPSTVLAPGDRVRTPAGASARVEYKDGTSIALAGGSSAVFRPVDRKAAVLLLDGRLDANVAPLERDDAFVCETERARVTVIGTEFSVSLHGEETIVDVREGRVDVRDLSAGRSVVVSAGHRAVVGRPAGPAVIALTGPVAGGRAYYVDCSDGRASDENPGTEDSPFRTIGRAAELVQPGDAVVVRPGVYREMVGLTRSGTADRPILFVSERPGKAVVTGADVPHGWRHEGGGVHSVPWTHDFIIDSYERGGVIVYVRSHLAPPPAGCAEIVLCNGRPLRRVMQRSELEQGTFSVDWDADLLYVRLPGDASPGESTIEAGARAKIFGPRHQWNQWAKAEYVHVRGFVFRCAANFAQRAAVRTDTGWVVEDCTVEWTSGAGLDVSGDHVELSNVRALNNGQAGIGVLGNHISMRDCTVAGNSWKLFPTTHAFGIMLSNVADARIDRLTVRDNIGIGLWLIGDVRRTTVTGSLVYGNRGRDMNWEGAGVVVQDCSGPITLSGNVIYSNTGAGIDIAESSRVTVSGNTIVDNGNGVSLRAMPGTVNDFADVSVSGNSFARWRQAGVATSLGEWGLPSARERRIVFRDNVYDPVDGKPIFAWAGERITSLEDARRLLGVAESDRVGAVEFGRELIDTLPALGSDDR